MNDYAYALPLDASLAQVARVMGHWLLIDGLFQKFSSTGVLTAAITRAYRLLGGRCHSNIAMTRRIDRTARSLAIDPWPGDKRSPDAQKRKPRYCPRDAKQILVDLLEADMRLQASPPRHRGAAQAKSSKQPRLTPDEVDRVEWYLTTTPSVRLKPLIEGLHDHGHELRDLPALTAEEVGSYLGIGRYTMEILKEALDYVDRDFAKTKS